MIHNNLTSIPDNVFVNTRLGSLWVKNSYTSVIWFKYIYISRKWNIWFSGTIAIPAMTFQITIRSSQPLNLCCAFPAKLHKLGSLVTITYMINFTAQLLLIPCKGNRRQSCILDSTLLILVSRCWITAFVRRSLDSGWNPDSFIWVLEN